MRTGPTKDVFQLDQLKLIKIHRNDHFKKTKKRAKSPPFTSLEENTISSIIKKNQKIY